VKGLGGGRRGDFRDNHMNTASPSKVPAAN
jgi:hypothetical protein